MEAFSRHYRTYAVDTVGAPNKSVLTRPISLVHQRRDFTDWMSDLLDGLKIEDTYMVGNSYGGFLALNTAYSLPERVKKVVLISPAATFVPIHAWTWHFAPANILGPLLGSQRMLIKPYTWIWQDLPAEQCIAQLRRITAITGRPRHWSPTIFSDEELRQIRTPTLLLIGDHEVVYKPEDAIRRATRLVAGLKAEIVPSANHLAQYTAAETVNKKVLAFLAE